MEVIKQNSPLKKIITNLKEWYHSTAIYRLIYIISVTKREIPPKKHLGYYGKNVQIGLPCKLTNPQAVYLYENVRIQPGATILISPAGGKFICKKYTVISYNLFAITGNHKKTIGIPQFALDINHINDVEKDIVIQEDVWIGANVTITAGSIIGRGAIIGACTLVRKKVPPYCVAAGVPAKIVGIVFTIEDIIKHEKEIYEPHERFSLKELQEIFKKYDYNKYPILGNNTLSETARRTYENYKKKYML